jgi:hypothetical protein
MKQTMTIREFLKEQSFKIAFNLTMIILFLLKYIGGIEKGVKFLVICLLIFLTCWLIINTLILKLDLFKDVLEEKSKRKYMQLINWSTCILVLIASFLGFMYG